MATPVEMAESVVVEPVVATQPAPFVRVPATLLFYVTIALFAYGQSTIGPSMPFIRERLGFSLGLASLHFMMGSLGGITSSFFGARIARRIPRRQLLWGSMAMMTASLVVVVIGPSPWVTIPAMFLSGISGAQFIVTNTAGLADLHGSSRATAFAESNVAASAASILSPLAVGLFAGFGPGYWAAIMLLAAMLVPTWLWGRSIPLPEPEARVGARPASGPFPLEFRLLTALSFLGAALEWCVAYWCTEFLKTEVGMPAARAATAMTVFPVAMLLGRFVGARLTRSIPPSRILVGAVVVTAIGFPIFWLPTNPPVNVFGLFVTGLGIANLYPMLLAAATASVPDRPVEVASRLVFAGASAMLLLPPLLGMMAGAIGLRNAYWMVAILLVVALVIAVLSARAAAASGREPVPA